MIVSRALAVSKLSRFAAKNLLQKNDKNCINKIITRGEHEILYRKYHPFDAGKCKLSVTVGAILWWWFFWHLFTDYHELAGHSYPNPSEWTDEELGIPPE